jgi:hypothetical protein
VTDEVLKELKSLTRLRYLILKGTKATEAGMRELKNALPECYIIG